MGSRARLCDHRAGHQRSDIVREVAESEVIMTCVAVDYPDDSFAANAVRTERVVNDDSSATSTLRIKVSGT
jgi:hypothetical protein